MSTKNAHYHVAPRYTPGSPAMVDREIALRVADEEKRHWSELMDGVYGEDAKLVAQRKGLHGIAEFRVERKNGFDVQDLVTGKQSRREDIKASKVQAGDLIIKIKSGRFAGSALDQGNLKVARMAKSLNGDIVYIWENMGIGPFDFSKNDLLYIERGLRTEERADG
jgi:hypothetical protein